MLYESYFAPYDADSRTNAFSVAKAITTMQVVWPSRRGTRGST